MTDEKKAKIGIVGCGIQTQLIYLPELRKNKKAEIVALCDIDPRKLQTLVSRYNIPRHYEDFQEFIRDPELEAVIIATPNYLHYPMTIAALEYDKDVLVETPMATNASEAREMVKLAKKKKKILLPAIYQKLRSDVQLIKNFIDNGELGKIYYSKAGWLRGRAEWAMKSWYAEKMRAGGGAFLSLGSQILDIALYLSEPQKPISIVGVAHRRFMEKEVPKKTQQESIEDAAFAMLRFSDEQIFTLEVSFSMLQEKDFSYYNAFGTKGAALLNPVSINREMHGHLVNVTPKSILNQKDYIRAAYRLLVEVFIDGITLGVEMPIKPEDGLIVNQIIDAFYKSATFKKEVPIKL
ncbi:MAG: Gfo/Idh/MocA family oxidoreductase [candidate division WOR-3 bacterium]|nr:Gfo/Idh/MocA family oxidoreductase [candidate division WOR-3 bacterium]MCX7756858.1 Gfo/Idh/MocA family oxidoreductase [candidate division WOR-3 bacterium]MDW7987630.1 Gfo/Idh/MocA family oxidoreductase [candidate division WOR-3 bacterium]